MIKSDKNVLYRVLNLWLILFILLVQTLAVSAQSIKFPNSEASRRVDGHYIAAHPLPDTIIVWNNQWDYIRSMPTTWREKLIIKSLNSFVKFGINTEYSKVPTVSAPVDNTYKITYKFTGYSNPIDTNNTSYVFNSDDTLTVGYNSFDNNQPYQDLNYKKYSGFYKIRVIITNIFVQTPSSTPSPMVLPDPLLENFYIEGSILTQPYYKQNYGTGSGSETPNVTALPDIANNILKLNWTLSYSNIAPISYQLQWLFVDNYNANTDGSTTTPMAASSLAYDFSNATTITLDSNSFKLPLSYPKGYLVYRVRVIRPDSNYFSYPIYGNWTLNESGNISTIASDISKCYYNSEAYTGDSLNWQYTISFAEEGKYKHVGSFFDGLLKNRQSITRFNSDLNKLIVTDNVYDYEGRLCISTLPAPTVSSKFRYLNNVKTNAWTLEPYKASDFDSGFSVCPTHDVIAPLANNALANVYYSSYNPDISSITKPWQKFIPNAEGYPFIQTEYEAGYNDRVKSKGGAGKALQIGDTNYLKQSYAGISQKKLNALFGKNIGWNSFYNSIITTDANGQISINVKDYEGRLTYSAMIGLGPDSSRIAIDPSITDAAVRYRSNILYPASLNQEIDSINRTISVSTDFYNQATAPDSLTYEYEQTPYPACPDKNIYVKAHLNTVVTNQCGELITEQNTTIGTTSISSSSATYPQNIFLGTFGAQIGQYSISKKLSFYKEDIDEAVDTFMNTASCLVKENTFIKNSIDSTIFPCKSTDVGVTQPPCEQLKWDMMQQLLPGGVYAKYQNVGDKIYGVDNSIFTASTCYADTFRVKHLIGTSIIDERCVNINGHSDLGKIQGQTYLIGSPGIYSSLGYINFNNDLDYLNLNINITDTCVRNSEDPYVWGKASITFRVPPGIKKIDSIKAQYPQLTTSLASSSNYFYMTYSMDNPLDYSGELIFIANYLPSMTLPVTGRIVFYTEPVIHDALNSGGTYCNITFPIRYNTYGYTSCQLVKLPTETNPYDMRIGFVLQGSSTPTAHTEYLTTLVDSIGNIDSGKCVRLYQNSCLVPDLKDTITVGGIFYNRLRSMRVDSFIRIYNSAVAEGNYSIAEALLPLHPQYCAYKNCFNDTFKTRVEAITDWQLAEKYGLLLLDSLVAKDPLKTRMAGSGLYPSPADTLKKFLGTTYRLDTFVLMNAYCMNADSTLFKYCAGDIYKNEIANRILVNSSIKKYYYTNVLATYFSNRKNIVDKLNNQITSVCSQCSSVRLTLDTSAALAPAGHLSSTSNVSDSSMSSVPHSSWGSSISGMSTAALADSAAAYYHALDSMITIATIDSILSKLSNCIAGNATLRANIKNSLRAIYTSGAVAQGNFSQEQIMAVLTANGVSYSDLCNPYLLNYKSMTEEGITSNYSCESTAYFTKINAFLNRPAILSSLQSAGTTSVATLDTVTNIFERNIARRLHNNVNVSIKTTYTASTGNYRLDVTTAASALDTVKFYFRAPDCPSYFTSSGTYTLTASCLNNNAIWAAQSGLVNQLSFIVDAVKNTGATCTMLTCVDSIAAMGNSDNVLNKCVSCNALKSLYKDFRDTLSAYGIKGVDHPYYQRMLMSFMNKRLKLNATAYDYDLFIKNCALSDSFVFPLYDQGYSTFSFSSVTTLNSLLDELNSVDPEYNFDRDYRDSILSTYRIAVDLKKVPENDLWRYKNILNDYAAYGSINNPFKMSSPGGGAFSVGYLITDPGSFSPRDSSILDTSFIKFRGPYTKGVWNGSVYEIKSVYDIVANSGTPAYRCSPWLNDFQQYLYAHSIQGVTYRSAFAPMISEDRNNTLKQSYLAYTYQYDSLPNYKILDSLQESYLSSRIPAYSGYQVAYRNNNANRGFTNLYLYKNSMNNRLFDTLQTIIQRANVTTYGSIFYNAPTVVTYATAPVRLKAYHCADNSYWYQYFTTGDTLYNLYVQFPDYIPASDRADYKVVGIYPYPDDSVNRAFLLKVKKTTDTTNYFIEGRADFSFSKSIVLENVLMGEKTKSLDDLRDTANNCERARQTLAIVIGKNAYRAYLDSVKDGLKKSLANYLVNSVREKLFLTYWNQEFQYTLYHYDRAGNLVATVPPAGVQPIPAEGIALDVVDTCRMNNTPGLSPEPTYTKSNQYEFNSYNLVKKQTTIDGGTTRFFYDRAGRLIFSQNAKQAETGKYTYNLYDKQNRIYETGQVGIGCSYFEPYTTSMFGISYISGCHYIYYTPIDMGGYTMTVPLVSPDPYIVYNLENVTHDSVRSYIRKRDRTDVIVTIYDTQATDLSKIAGLSKQQNLRKRISCVKFIETMSSGSNPLTWYSYATHYSYDMEGNVNCLVQDFPDLTDIKQRYKRVDYDYDLLSGKVNMLSYNRGWPDQYYQRYEYDADNRLVNVHTSNDGYIWHRDAEYFYYDHGPLARTEIGDQRIQGVDYAYTIQGWLKAVNTDTLTPYMDMGGDGMPDVAVTAKDAVAYTIDYFRNDYKPISATAVLQHTPTNRKGLYNGNIAAQTVAIDTFQILNKQYAYDQLNRIKRANYHSTDMVSHTVSGLNDYKNNYTYDADGNILTLNRYGNAIGGAPQLMDSFKYVYPTTSNRLKSVIDYAADVYSNDVKQYTTEGVDRYAYDAIGNTTKDLVSAQNTIKWNLYNKVKSADNTAANSSLTFKYDAQGNRVAKKYKQYGDTTDTYKNTYYVRDAQGNILAVYNENMVSKSVPLTPIPYLGAITRLVGGRRMYNANFVVPEMGSNGDFETELIARLLSRTSVVEAVTNRPVSFFLSRSGMLNDFLFADPGYIPQLIERDLNDSLPILLPALADYSEAGDDEGVISPFLQLLYQDTAIKGRLLQATVGTSMGKRVLMGLHVSQTNPTEDWSQYLSVDSLDALSADSLLTVLATDSVATGAADAHKVLLSLMRNSGTTTEWWPKLYTQSGILGVSSLYSDPYLSAAFNNIAQQALVNNRANDWSLYGFFDAYQGSATVLKDIVDTRDKLHYVYNEDQLAFLDTVTALAGGGIIDSSVSMAWRSSSASLITALATDMPSLETPFIAHEDIIKERNFYLAEHDIYGSSRLGIKGYYPNQVGIQYNPTSGYFDTLKLWSRQPWYSHNFQEVMDRMGVDNVNRPNSMFMWGQHIIGQKQYELSDHLGNVLATLSDKRKTGNRYHLSGYDSISSYAPISASLYDYYPFGQYMPGRYSEDTGQYCFTSTHTEMVTTVTYTRIKNHLAGLRKANGGSSGGDVIFTDITNGVIKLTATNVGSGGSIDIDDLLPGIPVEVTVEGKVKSGKFVVQVVDVDSGKVLNSDVWGYNQGTKPEIVVDFIPREPRVRIDIILEENEDGPGIVELEEILVPVYHTVPVQVVSTVCSDDEYRYGFNGQMKVNEIAGVGNHNTALYWEYDTRLGRRWNVDPVDQVSASNYSVLSGNPISRADPLGNTDDIIEVDTKGKSYSVTKTNDSYDVVVERRDNGKPGLAAAGLPNNTNDGKTLTHFQKGSWQKYLNYKGYAEKAPLHGAQSEEFAVEMAAADGAGKLVGRGLGWAWSKTFGKAAVEKLSAEGALWAQKTFSGTFSEGGTLAGKTVDEVAAALKSGDMSVKDIPIDLIKRGENTFILNTRSSAALEKAGIPRSSWNTVNRSGDAVYESRLTDQLTRNNIPNGTTTVRESGTQNTIGN